MAKVNDPVCGMEVEAEMAAASATYQGQTSYFCPAMCKTELTMIPARYLGQKKGEGHHAHH